MEPSSQSHPDEENITFIWNDKEFLNHLYNRYNRIRVDTLIDVLSLLKTANTLEGATNIIRARVGQDVFDVCDNQEDITELQSKIFKRGNPRRSKIGL